MIYSYITLMLCSYHRCNHGGLRGNSGGGIGVQGEHCHVGVCGVIKALFLDNSSKFDGMYIAI